ncbi:MAG: acyl-CoA thioesterase [Phycisphaerales bacterium]|nr:acyl-CoA thioesterase [Phycisphaerales bacterium]
MSCEPSDGHVHRMRVRYAECDPMGYLHHARYFEFLEEARTEALRVAGISYRELEASGVFFVVVKLVCRYHRPIRYDDVVTIRTNIVRFTRTRIDHAYELAVDGRRTTEAESTLACVGRDGRPMVMPDRIWCIRQESRPRRGIAAGS